MKRLSIIVLITLVATTANAQDKSKACYDKIKASEDAFAKTQLDANMVFFDKSQTIVGGKFPKCASVVKIYNDTKSKIFERFKNECIDPAIITDLEKSNHKLSADFDSYLYASRLRKGSEGELAQKEVRVVENDNSGGGICFGEDTKLTIYNVTKQTMDVESFKQLSEYWDKHQYADTFEKIYVLSSPIEIIPDAPAEYLTPCWAEVSAYTYSGLNAPNDDICTVAYDGADGTRTTCIATPDHRFRVEVCDKVGNKTCEWKHLKDINPETMKFISESGKSVRIESIFTNKVEEKHWAWVSSDMLVYNLKVETGTYYVGDRDHRVLVHNVY